MATLRTDETEAEYKAYRDAGGLDGECVLCGLEPLRSFTHWKIVQNRFPYDRVADRHDMILPLRHATEDELTPDERAELEHLRESVMHPDYDLIIEATHRTKTIPAHYHLHLIGLKRSV